MENKTNFLRPMGLTYSPGKTDTGVQDWGNCTRCALHHTRKRVAIIREGGHGSIKLLFIGEAPGVTEDATGYPFVGDAGRILNWQMKKCHYNFKYLITNMIGCRPVDLIVLDYDKSDTPISELQYGEDYEYQNWNRDPTAAEIEQCSPHIDELISTFEPHGIVRLGKVAQKFKSKLPTLNLLHPSYILRLECKLLTAIKEVRKLELFIEQLKEGLHG